MLQVKRLIRFESDILTQREKAIFVENELAKKCESCNIDS